MSGLWHGDVQQHLAQMEAGPCGGRPPAPSPRSWTWGSPLALALTVLIGVALFTALGKDPVRGPAGVLLGADQVRLRAGRAERQGHAAAADRARAGGVLSLQRLEHRRRGQFIVGAIAAGGVALLADKDTGRWIVRRRAAGRGAGRHGLGRRHRVPARPLQRQRDLVSLMLVYVAIQVLGYLVYGPWKDPGRLQLSADQAFEAVAQVPRLLNGSREHRRADRAGRRGLLWVYLFRTRGGFAQQVGGLAPAAARYAGSRRAARCGRRCWFRAAPPGWPARWRWRAAAPAHPHVPAGWFATAIIVAFVGRLHPFGMVLRRS